MQETKAERTGVVPETDAVESEIENPQDQDRAKSENPPTKPAAGRLPARASRI
jgi:hypothetical protein